MRLQDRVYWQRKRGKRNRRGAGSLDRTPPLSNKQLKANERKAPEIKRKDETKRQKRTLGMKTIKRRRQNSRTEVRLYSSMLRRLSSRGRAGWCVLDAGGRQPRNQGGLHLASPGSSTSRSSTKMSLSWADPWRCPWPSLPVSTPDNCSL